MTRTGVALVSPSVVRACYAVAESTVIDVMISPMFSEDHFNLSFVLLFNCLDCWPCSMQRVLMPWSARAAEPWQQGRKRSIALCLRAKHH